MEQIPTDRQFLKELRICNLGNIGITVILPIASSVVIHCLLQCRSNANIIDNQTAFLISKYTVYSGNSLHQIIPLHRLVHIHGCKRWHIKSCKPHIHDNGNLQRTIIILKLLCQLILMVFIADDFIPFFWIFVTTCHNNSNLIRPSGTKLQDTLIYLHGNRA